jgi:Ca-activated chloride channel family protein
VQDLSMLPQVFTTEALAASRALLREDPLSPRVRTHPLTQGISRNAPALDAYVASTLKPSSEVLLEGARQEPLLAVGRQGLGRSAALTTDLNAWAGALGAWQDLPAVLSAVVRWLQTSPAEYSANVTQDGPSLKIVVDAVQDGRYINDQALEIRYGDVRASLEQVAPGRYEGRMDVPTQSGYLLVVNEERIVARTQVSAPSAEFETRGSAALMRDLPQLTGGLIYEVPGSYNPPTPTARTAAWPFLAVAGLLAFMLELVARRFWSTREQRA